MAAASDARESAARHVGNPLTRKLGPLPAWAWAIIGGAGLYFYRNRGGAGVVAGTSSGPQDVNPATGLPWNIDPATGQPYGDGGGGGSSSPGPDTIPPGGDTTPPPAGTPTPDPGTLPPPHRRWKMPKPRLKKKPKRPRKRRPASPAHGQHRAHPPHRKPGPKRKLVLPSRHPLRDRKGVAKPAGGENRQRLKQVHAGAGQHAAGGPVSAVSRSSSSVRPQGARPHAGGLEAPEGVALSRPQSAFAAGRVTRTRTLAAPRPPAVPRQEPAHRAPPKPKPARRRRR